MRLYELPAHYRALEDLAAEGEDVSTALAQLDEQVLDKAPRLIQLMKGVEAEAEALRAEERRLCERRQRLERSAETFRAHVRDAMLAAGIDKIKGPTFTLTLRDGPVKVLAIDEQKLPDAWWRVKREPNRSEILRAFKEDGEVVEGAEVGTEPCLYIR